MSASTGTTPAELFGTSGPGERHAAYAALAACGPAHRMELPDGTHAWLITGHDAVRSALTDPRLTKESEPAPAGGLLPPEIDAAMNNDMLHHDPPDHTRLRRLVSAAFTRRRVDALAPRIQGIADALLDDLVARPTVDLITAFAYPLPITVISELLGVPVAAQTDFRDWSTTL
ncbi:MAG: hypothetical protein QOI16_159, partial [Pseudonocardiales bacterium]|nr:hypothetical protein [Pseudonocardiales bacterium]